MEHSFDVEVAKQYGIECAIVLKHIFYWTEKNRTNERHFFDGRYWTFNSVKAFSELFPYITAKKMRGVLEKLENEELIITGCFNQQNYDRTKWYAITEKGKSILLKGQIELPVGANGIAPWGEPIPDIKPNINTDINNIISPSEVKKVVDAWNALSEFGIKPVRKLQNGTKRYSSLVARIRENGVEAVLEAIEEIKRSKFLLGKSNSKRYWVITFDWFVLPNNFPKVYEGNYRDSDYVPEKEKPKEQDREDRFASLEPSFKSLLESKGVIQGQSLVLSDATDEEVKKLQEAGVL